MSGPVIGVSANLFPREDRHFYKNKELVVSERSLINCVLSAGGVPLSLPVSADKAVVIKMAGLLDGLLLSGGADVDPGTWGGPSDKWPGQPERDHFELLLMRITRERGRPVLGVCRGLQIINVAMGGTLIRDIATERPLCRDHRSQELYDTLRHPISIKADSWLSQIYSGAVAADVNSVHHQAIDRIGDGLQPLAWSDDGLIEAADIPDDAWTRAVQWHPEWDDSPPNQKLFEEFVAACVLD